MKSIVLPAGTEHVQFGELAHLIADALWPDAGPDDDSMTKALARINLDDELARAVDSGALPVKDPLTLGPHTYPVGNALRTARVTVDDLQRFVSDRGLSVIVEPQAAAAPAAKVKAGTVVSASGDEGVAITTHKLKTKNLPLDAEIAIAKSKALEKTNVQCVWDELVKMANKKEGCLIGEGDINELQYGSIQDPEIFKKKQLADRIRERKGRAKPHQSGTSRAKSPT